MRRFEIRISSFKWYIFRNQEKSVKRDIRERLTNRPAYPNGLLRDFVGYRDAVIISLES